MLRSTGLTLILVFTVTLALAGHPAAEISITGSVKNSLTLSLEGLKDYPQTNILLTDIETNGRFNGVFVFKGVSLKKLLRLAVVEKKETDFIKPVDLSIVLRNRSGLQSVLSWGEVFFKDPGHAIIALSATPVFPHKGSSHFKDEQAYANMMATLNRDIHFPRLVIAGEKWSDRCIEDVSEIDVVDIKSKVIGKKSPTVFSPSFLISLDNRAILEVERLPDSPRETIHSHVVGMGRGYHGSHLFSGTPLTYFLLRQNIPVDLNTVFIVSAPDAYRALLSYGELFLNTHGSRILVADSIDGKAWENGGKFVLILPDDQMADREVKAIAKIEVVRLAR